MIAAGVYAEKGEYDSLFLSNYIDVYVKDALKRVPGVADVTIFGERKYSMRLWLDPLRLAARQITAGDVTNALREQNVQVAAGALGQAPAPQGQMYQLSVRVEGRLPDAPDFDNIIVKAGADGSLVRLKDVGHAELGAETYSAELRFQAQEAVGFGVIQLPSANALDVSRNVRAELERARKELPARPQYQIALDTTEVVSDSIREVLKTLVRSDHPRRHRHLRVPADVAQHDHSDDDDPGLADRRVRVHQADGLFHQHADALRHHPGHGHRRRRRDRRHREHRTAHPGVSASRRKQAAVDAMGEVLGAVIATALVLIAVFVPIAFFPGTTGRLYAQFAMTIAFAVALSAFNAVTLTPALVGAAARPRAPRQEPRLAQCSSAASPPAPTSTSRFLKRGLRSRWALVRRRSSRRWASPTG